MRGVLSLACRGWCSAAIVALLVATSASAKDVRVGAKIFAESEILQHLAGQAMRARGVDVELLPPVNGVLAWTALSHGSLDAYVDYTGTIREQIFAGRSLPTDADVRSALAEFGVGMTASLGFEDTYAVGLTQARAAALGVGTISDLAKHPECRLVFSNEFLARNDGWPRLLSAYGFKQTGIHGATHDLAYQALLAGDIDATDLYSTDAQIKVRNLKVLVDDRRVLPDYHAVFLYRLGLPAKAVDALRSLEGQITADQMIAMNVRAEMQHVPPEQVAGDFLNAKGNAVVIARPPSLWETEFHYTLQHLLLVSVSMALAIVVAIPLGVLAAEFPLAGHVVLGLVAALFTIPSIALLAAMVPLLGLGRPAAILALFLYSMLPIVRNTHAGIVGIPATLRESADVLGLSRWVRLTRVELPMAMPSIFAGLKTALVLNVGMATLGGVISAGGYGEPIWQGIELVRPALIWQGAVPAAVMALLIQYGFDWLEPWFVPRGIRRK